MTKDIEDKNQPILEIDEIFFSYSKNEKILSNLSLNVNKGEFVSILGDSGAGKTSLLRVINGLEKIDEGYIRLEGQLLSSAFYHISPEKRSVGTIFQDFALFPHLNVKENIYFGLNKKDKYDETFVEHIINLLHVEKYLNRYVDELSGGQKQRVSLARSLVRKPKLLLMDEPFSNLDRGLRVEIRREIKMILKNIDTTVILITHDSEEALSLSDKIAFILRGEIIQYGTPFDIFYNPKNEIIAKSIRNSNILDGEISNGIITTEIGKFKSNSKFKDNNKVKINVSPNQLGIVRDKKQFTIIQKEFVEGDYLYIIENSDNKFVVRMNNSEEFYLNELVGIVIKDINVQVINISL